MFQSITKPKRQYIQLNLTKCNRVSRAIYDNGQFARLLSSPGEISMEKVKVKRYVSGKRPDYAPMDSSDEEEEDFQFIKKAKDAEPEMEMEEEVVSDPRLKRLLNRVSEDAEERWR